MRFPALALVLLVNLVPCHSQESAQHRDCINTANTQSELNSCADRELARAESDLRTVFERLLSKAKRIPGAGAKVEAAEKAWIQYRDAYMEALYPEEDKQTAYGTVYPMEYADFRTGLTQEQTKALREMESLYDEGASGQ